ncbi:MAG: glycosyltransferase family 2 protein [Chloroflexota bacterium]
MSAIMCTRNRPDSVGAAVASVLANDYPDFTLTIVDQSTDDRTGEIVRSMEARPGQVRYIHSSVPGLSRAYNLAIRETDGEILAFTDDDCIAPTDWITTIVAAFESEPDADLLYGQVLEPEALRGHDGIVPQLHISRPERLDRRDGFRIYGMGANFGARRRLFDKIHGFDEILGGGGPLRSSQDFDLQYRAYLAGVTTLLRPEVKVDHYGIRSKAQWPAQVEAYAFGDGAFYCKHVRCGDFRAISLLIGWIGRPIAREILSRLQLRKRPSSLDYLKSFLDGMRGSLAFPVDREQRLYLGRS